MGQVRHGSATTTHAIRAAIQRSQASIAALSKELGINPKTVAKWRKRETVEDRRNTPQGTPHRDKHGRQKGGRGRLIGRTKGGMNTKLHAICDSRGRPLKLFVTAGQVSDYIGARALLGGLQNVRWLLGDRG